MSLLSTLEDLARSIFTFLWLMTLLVVVHELGHYLFARLFGMKVNAFAVFMGGIRRTDLRDLLERPLASRWYPAGLALLGLALLCGGAVFGSSWAAVAGVLLCGPVTAMWVSSRLGKLYHIETARAVSAPAWCIAGACVLLVVTGNARNFSLVQMASVLGAGAWIGALWLYYQPTRQRSEDDKMGTGTIDVDGSQVRVEFRPVWCHVHKGIEYSLLAMPLGGFVAIDGMSPREDGSESKVEGGFLTKPAWQRFVTLAAGPAFSLLLGVVLLFAGSLIVGDLKRIPVVGAVVEGSAAQAAGIVKGDRLLEVNHKPVENYYQFVREVRGKYTSDFKGIPIDMAVLRDGKRIEFTVTPKVTEAPEPWEQEDGTVSETKMRQARIGIMADHERIPISIGTALNRALTAPVLAIRESLRSMRSVKEASENVGGTITIVRVAGEASKEGIGQTLFMGGMLSISLGIMNLLPLGGLDGGQMLIALIEMVRRGRRLSYRLQALAMNFGTAVLVVLIFSVLALDLGRAVGGKSDSTPKTATPKR